MTGTTSISAGRLRRGLLAPLFLMALGTTFLAVDLGYVDPHELHALAHLAWPVVLVLIGVEIVYARRTPYLALVAEILIVAVAAVAIALA
jgi:hypothetical protein